VPPKLRVKPLNARIEGDGPTLSKWRAAEYVLLTALAVAALLRWVHLLEHIRSYYVDLPTWDYWRVVQNLAAYRAGNLRVFWLQHNEHRIILPEIVFALDMLWFQGRKILPTAVGFACYVGTLVVLASALAREKQLRTSLKWAAFLLASITLGWMGSAVVLCDPFLLQWTILHFLIASALTLLSVARHRSSRWLLMASILCAGAATYTSGNGMLLWPVLLAAGLLLRLPKSDILLIVLCAAVTIGVFFLGYRSMGHVSFTAFFAGFPYSLGFIASYLGMPFGLNRPPSFGIAAGCANMLLFVSLFWTALRKGQAAARPAIVLSGVFAFTLLSAVLASAGRMDPADRTFVRANQARYVTMPLVNWAALILFSISRGSRGARTFWSAWRVPGVICLALLLGFRHLSSWVQARDAEVADFQLAALGVEAGVLDDAVLKKIFPDPAFVRLLLPELRTGRLSIYSEEEASWLGKPLRALSSAFLPPQTASLRYELALPSGSELAISVGTVAEWLVLADPQNVIVGLGRRLPAGIPFALETPFKVQSKTKRPQAMFAFVNSKLPLRSLHVYLVRDGDHALTPLVD